MRQIVVIVERIVVIVERNPGGIALSVWCAVEILQQLNSSGGIALGISRSGAR
jgi:hypothetical protein